MNTDSTIIRRSLAEPSAFAEVFDRHARSIGRYATQRVGVDAGADVLSETFLVAFRKRGAFDQTWESARPWLLGIAARLIKKHRAVEARQWRAVTASVGSARDHSDGNLPRADARMDAVAAVAALDHRLAALPARDRETLLLYAWGDLSYEEIGRALGVPVGTVRSRLNRVRAKLAGGLSADTRGEERSDGSVPQGA